MYIFLKTSVLYNSITLRTCVALVSHFAAKSNKKKSSQIGRSRTSLNHHEKRVQLKTL